MSSTDSSDEEDVVAYYYFRRRKQEKIFWVHPYLKKKKHPLQTIRSSLEVCNCKALDISQFLPQI
jgi:hypothetical protein